MKDHYDFSKGFRKPELAERLRKYGYTVRVTHGENEEIIKEYFVSPKDIAEMTKQNVKCLASNSDTGYIRELYDCDFFDIIFVQAKRAINSDPTGRGNVKEVLIKNWKEGHNEK